jgi:hypothetical protein
VITKQVFHLKKSRLAPLILPPCHCSLINSFFTFFPFSFFAKKIVEGAVKGKPGNIAETLLKTQFQ